MRGGRKEETAQAQISNCLHCKSITKIITTYEEGMRGREGGRDEGSGRRGMEGGEGGEVNTFCCGDGGKSRHLRWRR